MDSFACKIASGIDSAAMQREEKGGRGETGSGVPALGWQRSSHGSVVDLNQWGCVLLPLQVMGMACLGEKPELRSRTCIMSHVAG